MLSAIHRAFHWKHTSWVIALAGGAALTAALADKFELAYTFILICGVYSVGCWLSSDALEQKRPRSSLVLPDATLYVPSGRRYMLWKAIPTLLMIAFFAGCGYFVHRLQWVWELEQYEGWLYPANDPDPPCSTRFPVPEGATALYLGNSRLVAGADVTMWSVLVPQDRRIPTPVLVVERDLDPRIAIDLDVRGKDGIIVARIKHNYFIVNRTHILTMQRPDRSTLIVTDQEGTEVLNVRYLNRHVIHLLGIFYVIGQNDPIVISETRQDMGAGRSIFSGACNASYGWGGDVAMSLSTSGDGTGNHEYDAPGSRERPLSPVRKWNATKQEWESQFRHPSSPN